MATATKKPKAAKPSSPKAEKTPRAEKQPRTSKAKADGPKKMSALDAAYQVLQKSKEPMQATALVAAMAEQGLWSSPKGKTPHATLYAAMVREINTKGKEARFKKADRGHFTLNA